LVWIERCILDNWKYRKIKIKRWNSPVFRTFTLDILITLSKVIWK
jgi:hypothetical protein